MTLGIDYKIQDNGKIEIEKIILGIEPTVTNSVNML